MIQDLCFALRQLWKRPSFAFIAIATLALGIGANTAIFTVLNGVLLKALPYPEPDQLVTFESQQSAPELQDVRRQSRAFAALGGLGTQSVDYTSGSEPIQVEAGLAAGDFFQVLGARVILGRTFDAAADRFGGPRIAVLTHGLWQRLFGRDPQIIGRNITIGGQDYTVIGVTAPEFRPPLPEVEIFVPIHVFYPAAARSRGAHLLRGYGRLQAGVSMAQAQSEMRLLDRRMAQANPDENKNRASKLLSLQDQLVGEARPVLLILAGAVALVLLIACSNFANLLLVRVAQRRPELMIRRALGAGRSRIVRQVLTESILLAVFGGAAGLLLGSWGVDALLALKPEELPRVENIHLDPWVLGFTLGLSLLTGLIFGLVPAWQAIREEETGLLSGGTRSVTLTESLGRNSFVIAQLALALLLLIGAGLLGKTFYRLTTTAPGFNPDHILSARVELPEARYREIPAQTRFRNRVLENLNAWPELRTGMISELPLGGNAIGHNFVIEGRPRLAAGDEPELFSRAVAGDYFQVMNIPLRRGRLPSPDDTADTPAVGVINDTMARKYFAGQDPLGQRIRWARDEGVNWITIVGVTGDVRHFGLGTAEEPAIYTPYAQSGQAWKRWSEIVVRAPATIPRRTVVRQIKEAVWNVDPLLAVTKVRSMQEVVAVSVAAQRFNAFLVGIFAFIALSLAAIGLYGVLAFGVAQRTREIGIRVAVGAQPKHVLKLILGRGFALAVIGIGIGLAAAALATRVLRSLLYQVTPTDPLTFVSLSLLLLSVALAAGYVPARRAMKVDPVIALRHE